MSTKRKRHVSGHRVVDRALTPEDLKVRLQERDQRLLLLEVAKCWVEWTRKARI